MAWSKPSLFPELLASVEALNRAGRFQEALAAGATLYAQNRDEPAAVAALADTLEALDRTDEAQALLVHARKRFPDAAWLSARLAGISAARGAWAESVAHWRDAGLPATDNPGWLRAYALALAGSGEMAAARQALDAAPAHPQLRLAEAELLLRSGRLADAMDRWPALSRELSLDDPGFAALTGQLAVQAEAGASAPMWACLLAEVDPGTEDWRPAIAATLAPLAPSDPVHERVRSALKAAPGGGLAAAVAGSLAGVVTDSDALAELVARAIDDGRVSLLAPLLETAGDPVRTGRLRVALRLMLNRRHADPTSLDALAPRQAAALLMIARVADPACLAYVTDHLRPRLTRPFSAQLSSPQEVVAHIAHAALRGRAPAVAPTRLRVAICVSGRLASGQPPVSLPRALGLLAHDVTVFARTWARTEAGAATLERAGLLRRLPPSLAVAASEAADAGGMAGLRRLYPTLLQARAQQERIDVPQLRALFHTEHAEVVEDGGAVSAGRSPALRAHRMAVETGQHFDLCLHVEAGYLPSAGSPVDWNGVAARAAGGVLFADSGYRFDRSAGFAVGQRFAAGTMADMTLAAASPGSLAMQLHLNGIDVEAMQGLAFGRAAEPEPLSASAALALLWNDIRGRRPATPDSAMVRAAMAGVTGGMHHA